MTTPSTMPTCPVTECADALVIWVASTTVGAERKRLAAERSRARGVFGVYAESAHPSRVTQDLRALAGRPDGDTLIPTPHRFGATHASKLLPRGARAVGWLEADGYRSVAHAPQPDAAWLADMRRDHLV